MIEVLHRLLSSWFGFNRQQRNGLLVLCLLIVILFAIRLSLHSLIQPKPLIIADFSNSKLPVEELTSVTDADSTKSKNKISLFVFDPNTATKEQLIKLGFKEKTANTLINYRSKGGHFKRKEDLKKVYGLNDALYDRLKSFILIADGNKKSEKEEIQKVETKTSFKPYKIIELNSADSLELLSLRGIGPGYTKRILKYRNLLGGFYSVDQLKEVYGFPDSTFQLIKNDVRTDASLVSKIDLNSENFKGLNKHPYLSYEHVKAIFNYRKKNGPIKSIDQLREIIGDEALIEKLKPYLAF